MQLENNTLYYIYDPMCSWCYAFETALTEIESELSPLITFRPILGGLAPDSNLPMPAETQVMVKHAWQKIQQTVPGIQFNFDFWTENTPIRSTYPACRAILAAKNQGADFSKLMRKAIQQSYYQSAKNPSLNDTLIDCAKSIGLNTSQFSDDLLSKEINEQLQQHIQFSQSLDVTSYPSLRLTINDEINIIPINYTQPQVSLQKTQQLLNSAKSQSPASPCIKECNLNKQNMCSSCFRLLTEITDWPKMGPLEKQQCLDKCSQRKSSHTTD